jgi:flagellar protein FliT
MKVQDVINDYESLSNLTSEMRAAATAGDWDKLITLEQQSGQYVDRIRSTEEALSLDDASRERIVTHLKHILADDTEIRHLTQSWMGQIQTILNSNRQEQRLNQAYGAGG